MLKIYLILKQLFLKKKIIFYECSSLTSLNLSNFNTKNVENMGGMFEDCSSLTSLNTKDKRLLEEWKNK